MRVGVVVLPTDPWPETRDRARRVEALGYAHLWTYDHLSWRRYRDRDWQATVPWLAALAVSTSRIRLGTMVASPNFRHPVTLAKEAMTLDRLSEGRFVLGVGAGGPGYDAGVLGGPTLSPGERADRLDEFVEVLDLLLRQPLTSHDGTHYTVVEARMLPGCVQVPRVPMALAATGPRGMALAASRAESWITYGALSGGDLGPAGAEAVVTAQVVTLDAACDRAGRDPASIDRILLVTNEVERPLAGLEAFRDFAGRYRALGFTDLVFHHPRADDPVWDDDETMVEVVAAILPELA